MLQRFQSLYPYLPVFVQNLGISLYGLSYRNERLGGDYERHVAAFQERDGWSRSDMQSYLESQLRQVLLHAYDQVPFYRSSWSHAGIHREDLGRFRLEDLPRIPITSKETVRRNPDSLVAADVAQRSRLHRYYTSGSTGTPITTICHSEAHRKFVAGREVRSFGWAGVSVRNPRSVIGGRLVVPRAQASPPFHRYNLAERQTYFSAYHISPGTAKDYVEGFNRFHPDVLTGYAYSHYLLGRMMLDRGLKLSYRPKAVILGSEKLTREMRAIIEEAFGARAYEEYGAVENCVLVTECESGSLHSSSDFGILEIVDDRGLSVADGKEGRVVCTALLNEAQPMVRYDIGDLARLSDRQCSCGRHQLPVVEEIVGRLEDVVVCPDGRELVRFHGIFVNIPAVIEGQVVQEELDLLRIRVVTRDDFGKNEENLIRHRIVRERLGNVRVVIERVPRLERTERGKVRAVISKITGIATACSRRRHFMTPQPSPTRPFTRSVLLVGSFLSSSVGNRNPCEELAPRLQNRGFSVLTVSTRRSRAARLFDMLGTCWARRSHYALAQVDVFSGPAFVWAEMVCWLLKRLGKPYVLTLHGGALPTFAQRWPGRVRRLLNSAQIVTAPSGYLQEHLSAYRNDIRLLPNGVDLQAYPYRRRDTPQPRLVWLRAFHRIYNPALAVRVLARLVERFPTAHLTMVGLDKGDGSLQQTIDAARDLGVTDHIVFRGAVSKSEVPFWIDQGDIFLNTPNVDNTPVTVVEALACGACVVSTDVGGIRYLLDDRHDSLLVPPDDPDAMAEAVTRVLVEQGLGRRLSDNAKLKAARFDWPSVLDQWECVLTSVSSARQRPEDQGLLRTRPHQPVWTALASIGRFGEPVRRAPRTARPFPPTDGDP